MRVLILGGTREAAILAARIVRCFGDRLEVTTSLAGRLEPRPSLAGQVRLGGFGGANGLVRYLQSEAIRMVIDATHPFAAQISTHAAEACQRAGVPRLMLVRPPWRAAAADQWVDVETMAAAAAYVSAHSRRVFLATGPGAMKSFAANVSAWFLVRAFQQPDELPPLKKCEIIVVRPPFTVPGERKLLEDHHIDTLVSKNSGGPTEAKLTAARETGVRVVMVQRPALPEGDRASSVDEVFGWIATVL